MKKSVPAFDAGCQACPRLADYLQKIRQLYPDYFAAPVPAFGDDHPRLLIVGLAPGIHGANRTGRPFTGDASGELLYRSLFDLGLSNRPESMHTNDGLQLRGIRISNAVKCLPPQNKPTTAEVRQCNQFLRAEIASLPKGCQLLALGKIAHDAVIRCYGLKLAQFSFAHAARHALPDGRELVDSYHCSRYNTQTRRLTSQMFSDVLKLALAGRSLEGSG